MIALRGGACLLGMGAAFALTPCAAKGLSSCTQARETQAWPTQLAGRTLQAATADYVLYSQERAAAQELQQWLHRELVVFRARYGGEFNRPGLIFAIEPGDDPAPEIGEWHKIAVSYKGRPYTFFGSYFQESFYVSPSEAQRTSLINAASTRPAWICFLTTDTHTKQAFDAKVRRHRHDALEEWRIQWKDRSPDQKIVGAGFILLAELYYPVYRAIDVQLMHLQRRETLWQVLLESMDMATSRREELGEELRSEVDKKWTEIRSKRPIE